MKSGPVFAFPAAVQHRIDFSHRCGESDSLFFPKFLKLVIKADDLKQVRPPPENNRSTRLVDRILRAKTRDPEADTTVLESGIAPLVCPLYGQPLEGIATVEGTG